ncbi:MAG: monovalent cation/H(+) antiporter subunit G [Puniceicoccaceae bacterium]
METLRMIQEVVVVLLVLVGSIWILISGIGLIRLPDIHCRSHSLGKAATMGITLVLLGVGLSLGFEEAGLKVVLAIVFQFLTIPIAGHLLLYLAYRKNHPRWRERPVDQGRMESE